MSQSKANNLTCCWLNAGAMSHVLFFICIKISKVNNIVYSYNMLARRSVVSNIHARSIFCSWSRARDQEGERSGGSQLASGCKTNFFVSYFSFQQARYGKHPFGDLSPNVTFFLLASISSRYLRLAQLYFTSETVICCFSSINSSIGRAAAVLVNYLTKQLNIQSILKHALTRPYARPSRAR